MTERTALIEIENLHKTFYTGFWRKKSDVLKGVDLQVYAGETFGLLGPNGAGKTTTIKTLAGLVKPGTGVVKVMGKNPWNPSVRQHMGYLPEHPTVYPYLTGYEFLHLCGQFFNVPKNVCKQRIPELLTQVNLSEADARKQIRTYSKGMMQRLGFAQALIHDPDVLLLDEPMSGLDPLGRYDVKELVLNLKKQGKTILFNSHILSDVESICDRVGILVDGRVVLVKPVHQLQRPLDNLFHLRVQRLDKLGVTNLKRLSLRCVHKKGMVEASFNSLEQALKAVSVVRQSGGDLLELRTHFQSLEEVFVKEVKKAKEADII